MSIKLKKIDLSKRRNGHHDDVKVGNTFYLAKINNKWYSGAFSKWWYGLKFDGVYGAGYKLWDKGEIGEDGEDGWEELYEIVE